MSSSRPDSTTQRLPTDPFSSLPSINTFDGLSNFLRGAIADEDSRLFSESMGQLARQAEVVVAGLRASRQRDPASALLMDMLTHVREHHALVANLGLAWRGFYEHAAYLQALNNFRALIGDWLLSTPPWDDELAVRPEEFERATWRTLGEGMLLVDMYEQWLLRDDADEGPPASGELPAAPQGRVRQWWHRLRR